jgi:hypothetical protein
MAETESIRQIVHSRAPLSTWFGIVLLFALFGLIVLAVVGPSPRRSDYEETRAKKRMENLKSSREDAAKALNTYAWIDKNKGVARIPISRAMELTIAQLAQQKPVPAGPIATPASTEAAAGKPAAQTAPAGASPAPAGSPAVKGAASAEATAAKAAVSSPPAPGAASASPVSAQISPPAAASPAAAGSTPPAASPSPAAQSSPATSASPAPAKTP